MCIHKIVPLVTTVVLDMIILLLYEQIIHPDRQHKIQLYITSSRTVYICMQWKFHSNYPDKVNLITTEIGSGTIKIFSPVLIDGTVIVNELKPIYGNDIDVDVILIIAMGRSRIRKYRNNRCIWRINTGTEVSIDCNFITLMR